MTDCMVPGDLDQMMSDDKVHGAGGSGPAGGAHAGLHWQRPEQPV